MHKSASIVHQAAERDPISGTILSGYVPILVEVLRLQHGGFVEVGKSAYVFKEHKDFVPGWVIVLSLGCTVTFYYYNRK